MEHTWWNWHAVPGTAYWNMGHTAGTLRKIGTYFILRNNWHIDVPWNISKYLIEYLFFCSTHGFYIELYDVFYSIFWKLVYLIGTYIVQGFDMELWKLLSTALAFIWDPASALVKLRMYQVISLTDTWFCSEMLKYVLFLFLALVDDAMFMGIQWKESETESVPIF